MAETPRTKLPYPSENQDPWYRYFEQFCLAVDGEIFAGWEDRGYIIAGGGVVSWDASSGELAWDETIEITSSVVGFLVQFAADTLVMQEGGFAYWMAVRAPTDNVPSTFVVGTHVPTTGGENPTDAIPFAFRRNGRIYFRNGKVLGDGQSLRIFDATTPGGLTPPVDPTDNGEVAIALNGDLTYALITDAQVHGAADILVSKLKEGSDGQYLSTVGVTPTWVNPSWVTPPVGAGDKRKIAFADDTTGTDLDYADFVKITSDQRGIEFNPGGSFIKDPGDNTLEINGASDINIIAATDLNLEGTNEVKIDVAGSMVLTLGTNTGTPTVDGDVLRWNTTYGEAVWETLPLLNVPSGQPYQLAYVDSSGNDLDYTAEITTDEERIFFDALDDLDAHGLRTKHGATILNMINLWRSGGVWKLDVGGSTLGGVTGNVDEIRIDAADDVQIRASTAGGDINVQAADTLTLQSDTSTITYQAATEHSMLVGATTVFALDASTGAPANNEILAWNTTNAAGVWGLLVNANVHAAAAIAVTKLASGSNLEFLVNLTAGGNQWSTMTDALHGSLSGGSLHDDAIAGSPGTSGFISGVDQLKLDSITDPSGLGNQVAYSDGTDLNYAASVQIVGTEDTLQIGASALAGLSLQYDAITFGASVATPSITATNDITYEVTGTDKAHIFKAESTEVARFDNEGSPRLKFGDGGTAHIEAGASDDLSLEIDAAQNIDMVSNSIVCHRFHGSTSGYGIYTYDPSDLTEYLQANYTSILWVGANYHRSIGIGFEAGANDGWDLYISAQNSGDATHDGGNLVIGGGSNSSGTGAWGDVAIGGESRIVFDTVGVVMAQGSGSDLTLEAGTGASDGVVVRANSTEIVRFDNTASPTMNMPQFGKITGNFGGTNEAVFAEVFAATTLDLGPKHAAVTILNLYAGNTLAFQFSQGADIARTYLKDLIWDASVTSSPLLGHGETSAGDAVGQLTIEAQTSTVGDGADLLLVAGGSGGAGSSGDIHLRVAPDASTVQETLFRLDQDGVTIYRPGAPLQTLEFQCDSTGSRLISSSASIYADVPADYEHNWRVAGFSGPLVGSPTTVARARAEFFAIYAPYLNLDSNGATQGRIRFYEANAPAGNSMSIQAAPSMASDYVLQLPTTAGTAGQVLTTAGGSTSQLTWTTPATGDVVGPGSSTLNAIARYADGNGDLLADSGVTIDGSDVMDGVSRFDFSGATSTSGDLNLPDSGSIYSYASAASRRVAEITSGGYLQLGSSSGVNVTPYTYLSAGTQVQVIVSATPITTFVAAAVTIGAGVNLHIADEGEVRFFEDSGSGTNYAAIKAPATLGSDWTLTLPPNDGVSGDVLTTDGSGVASWVAPLVGAGGGILETYSIGLSNLPSWIAANNDVYGSWVIPSYDVLIAYGYTNVQNPGSYTAQIGIYTLSGSTATLVAYTNAVTCNTTGKQAFSFASGGGTYTLTKGVLYFIMLTANQNLGFAGHTTSAVNNSPYGAGRIEADNDLPSPATMNSTTDGIPWIALSS